MGDNGRYAINFWGEFSDKSIEKDFFDFEMKRYAKSIAYVVVIFGLIYMSFFISDFIDIDKKVPNAITFFIRLFFLLASIALCIAVRRIKNNSSFAYLITAYEFLAVISFLAIINQYESLTVMSFFSVIIMTLAAYIIPNKIRNSMFISVVLSITYFIFPAKNIEGIDTWMFLKIIAYDINITVFCCIASYLTNFYKRKLYADSIELTRVSSTDPLTGIYNRSKFNDELNYWVEYSHRYGSPVSVLIFDIDNFKNINDEYGHLSGDKILQEIVSTVKNTIRKSDVFSRWGGDEFLILLPNTVIDQASEMAERMRSNIQKIKSGEVENITCSFGLVYLKENESAEDVLKKADKLLYDAKGSGKNTVVTELNRLNFI